MAVSPDSASVYVTNGFDDNISQYDVGGGGVLTPKTPATEPTGAFPVGVVVSPDGTSVYVANGGGDDNISQYDVGVGDASSRRSSRPRSPRAAGRSCWR